MPRIAIVAAGIAGLNAALTLQDAGLACNISSDELQHNPKYVCPLNRNRTRKLQ